MVVADRQRVGVAERTLRGFGGRPHADPRQRRQRHTGLLGSPAGQAFQ
jgi:hypothetical protein